MICLNDEILLKYSAWVQISNGSESETVAVAFKASNGELVLGGETMATQGCWSLLKGGIVAEFTGVVEILLMVIVSVYSVYD